MELLAVVGPTASGKSEVGLALAGELGVDILSVDSMQVYRGMDIGTAKPTPEQRAAVRHHLVDVVDPEETFTVADAQALGRAVLEDAETPPIIVGGTGLAFRAIVDPLEFPGEDRKVRAELERLSPEELGRRIVEVDPAAADHLDLANPRRVIRALEIHAVTGETPSSRAARPGAADVKAYRARYPFRAVGLDAGPGIEARVTDRFDAMLAAGLLDEVATVAGRLGRTAAQAVGYKELVPVVAGEVSLAEARAQAIAATVALVGNQRTFFRRDPRITWLEWDDDADVRVARVRQELGL